MITSYFPVASIGLLVCLWLTTATTAFAQAYKGFNVGQYQGQVSNGWGKSFGKGTLDVRSISATGAGQAHIHYSDGLEGEGLLTGAINVNAVLHLNGTMTTPSNGAQWQPSLIAVVLPSGQFRMGARQTQGSTVETQTAMMTFISTAVTAPVVNANRLVPVQDHIQATYGSRSPRTCANTKAPVSGPISAKQAVQYFICGQEGVQGEHLYLVDEVQIQVDKGGPYRPYSDRMSNADLGSPVYPIRGSFMLYQVSPVLTSLKNGGKNCTSYAKRNASGACYRSTSGDWQCKMTDVSDKALDIRYNVAPPQ